ncbi:MAG TPA: hypothetical protein VN673_03465, partial [Clostridia bacterium]|nr:hypothetical protein [Clostridia bacterium]
MLVLAGAAPAPGAAVISPAGTAYLSISASAEYSSSFNPRNLFNSDVTGLAPGTSTDSTKDWAVPGTGPAYLEFELDEVYQVGSLFYAQRVGGIPAHDKVDLVSIWARTSTPFSPADPGTLPLRTLTITNKQSGIWAEYPLSAPVSGRYFLLKFEQNPIVGGNIGGNELRLGL